MNKGAKYLIIGAVAALMLASAVSAVYVHRQDLYCLYLYARCKTINSDDSKYKSEAAGKFYDEKSVYFLCKMLKDKDWFVRVMAALHLGDLGDKRAIEPLVQALNNPDNNSPPFGQTYITARQAAAIALKKLGDKRGDDFLDRYFKGNEKAIRDSLEDLETINKK